MPKLKPTLVSSPCTRNSPSVAVLGPPGVSGFGSAFFSSALACWMSRPPPIESQSVTFTASTGDTSIVRTSLFVES